MIKNSKKQEKFVSYLRVSTKEQGSEGLGIDVQREAIKNKVAGRTIEREFVEVASGKNNARPELLKAIAYCKETGSTLIVAKLDRLGRKAGYLFQIRDNVSSLVIVDHPNMTTMEFGMYATMAEVEGEYISTRTRDALAARERKTGLRNGNKKGCNMQKASAAGGQKRKEVAMINENNKVAKNIIEMELTKGSSYRKIVEYLNKVGIKTPTGKDFSVSGIQRVMKVFGIERPGKSDKAGKEK